ncbi:MAG: transcriptional repressor [Clostridia bacterium]|nr:transcriptional repressor [Clostridia bacterium]
MKEYSTRQRKLLIDFFKQHCDEQLTVKEIAGFADIHDKISLSALYRNIDKMLLEGIIQKYAKENGREFVYQYIDREKCAWHLHLKCTNCGKIIHLDDEATDNVRSMLKVKNNFSINEHKTILYGLCSACV